MNSPTLAAPLTALLRDPDTQEPLELDHDVFVNRVSGRRFPIIDGFPSLVSPKDVGPLNRKYQAMYDWMCHGYDLASCVGNWVTFGKLYRLRRQLAATAAIKAGDCALFTSIGTGADLPFLAERVPLDSVQVVGIDLSLGMLRRCRSRLARFSNRSLLVHANAENLPFGDGVFDVAVHVGGINFFDAPDRAVREMVRVTKPGSLIVISDETKDVVEKFYRRLPVAGRQFNDAPTEFKPLTWVPDNCTDVAFTELADGKLYLLTFRTGR